MAGIGTTRPDWDRFAHWAPGAAIFALVFSVALLVAAVWTERSDSELPSAARDAGAGLATPQSSGPSEDPARDADLRLYDRIAERVGEGENYYGVAVEEQRQRNFPVRPGLAVRLPTLAVITGWLGQAGMMIVAGLLGLSVIGVWWRKLGAEPGGRKTRSIAILLLVIGMVMGLKPQYLALHEVWSGVLLALSFGLHARGKWRGAWLAAALALAIREHALPFVLLMGALALWRRDWKETAAWGVLAGLFLAGLAWHLNAVSTVISDTDPLSPPWLVLRGLGGWTYNITQSSSLHLLPGMIAAPLALLPLLGWAGWKSDTGLFALLLFAGYGVFFMIAGRDNNFYWALMVMPVWFVGLAFLPRALNSLWTSARGH